MSGGDAHALKRALELHADRVAAYNAWHEAFRVYLLDEQERVYDVYVRRTIDDFNAINKELLALPLSGDAADMRARLLDAEQRKMRHTVEMQLLQKGHFIDAVKREIVEDELLAADRAGTNIVSPATHTHTHTHDHGHAHTGADERGPRYTLAGKRQPKQSDVYDNDARRLQRAIADVVEEINDVVDEMRYAADADL